MAGFRIEGNTSGNVAEVNALNSFKVVTETDASTNPGNVGGVRAFGENDQGLITGITSLASPEIDVDYRMRVAQDTMLDEEVFSYVSQNTGKHNLNATTMAASFTAGQYTSNSASITTITTGTQLATYAYFPNIGANTLSADYELAFSAQPVSNSFVEFGLGLPGGATVAPSDGVFFRLSSAGLQGIATNNGTETSTGVFPLSGGTGTWVYQNNKKYQFIVYMGGVKAEFWVNDGTGAVKLGQIPLPTGQSRMCMAQGMQVFHKHRIVGGAAGGVLQSFLGAYSVRLGGANITTTASTLGNRLYGSYQGLSGGTMGSLALYPNSANPTAAVPTNTTAALGVGLGGQFWETDTLAVTTDGIIQSFQVPAGTANVQGRRLVVRGVKIQTYVQTALTGGGYIAQWSLAFGHTAVSLATAEGGNTKAPRRIPLGIHGVPSAATVNSTLGDIIIDLGDAPIYVNPGEFIQVVKKKVGTAPTAGTLAYTITYLYGWE
jgi:hypothetical protein